MIKKFKNIDFKRLIERWFAYIITVIIMGIVIFNGVYLDFTWPNEIYNAVINMTAIIIGFMATMISVLISTTRSKILKKINDCGSTKLLKIYFGESIAFGFILMIYSIILLSGATLIVLYQMALNYVFIMLLSLFISATVRISFFMLRILENIMIENNDDSKNEANKNVARVELTPEKIKENHNRNLAKN